MNEKKSGCRRIPWVDIAKGIAIIAVVLGHIIFQYPACKVLPLSVLLVWLWHVPVFFMIGGFFLKEENLQNPGIFIKGKFRSLYLLIIYIYIPILLLHNVFLNIGFYDSGIEYYGKYVTEWGFIDFAKNMVMAICFAGREPILGAMWFVYVLFMALCALSIVSWGLKKVVTDETKYEYTRFIVLLAGAILSCLLTKLFGFTLPRVSNTVTAVWLIYVGMLLIKRLHLQFNNGYVALISGLIIYQAATVYGGVNIAANEYGDIVTLTINSCACLYLVCYISRLAENGKVGGVLAKIGEDSFYIMALHFLGFKMFSLFLLAIGYERNLAELCPSTGHNVFLLFGYLVAGVVFPLLVIFVIRKLKNGIIHCYRVSFHRGD